MNSFIYNITKWILLFSILCSMIYYIVIVIIFRIKSKFWYLQPCYHFYDLHYAFYSNQIINTNLPKINSYVSFEKVVTVKPEDLSKETFQYIIDLLKNEYYHTREGRYNPTIETILPYLMKNCFNSYITLAVTPTFIKGDCGEDGGTIIKYNDIVGCIMSKPLHIQFKELTEPKYVYYVDYFCIKKEYRKLGYSEIMIQSHEYANRHNNKNIQIHLFKREGELTGIVPLVKYITYLYPIPTIQPTHILLYNTSSQSGIIQINKTNIQLLNDYIKLLRIFDVMVYSSIINILELIETKNIFIFLIKEKDNILGCYFFRNTRMEISEKLSISCFASIKNNLLSESLFIDGFLQSLNIIQKENDNTFHSLFIEDIAHNSILINQEIFGDYISKSTTAYFLYNYISQPVQSKNFLFI